MPQQKQNPTTQCGEIDSMSHGHMGGEKGPLLADFRWMICSPEHFMCIGSLPEPGTYGYHFDLTGTCSGII